MHASASLLLRSIIATSLVSAASLAHAAENDSYVSAMRYVSLDASGDNADSRQYSGTGSFTLGKYMWLQGTVGKLTDGSTNGLGDLKTYGMGTGIKGEHLQFSINYNYYKNDSAYSQRDFTAALDWNADRFSAGLDAFHRTSNDSYNYAVTDTFPLLGTTTISTHAEQTLTGKGLGAHGTLNISDQLSLSLGGMSYSYDSDLHVSANVSAAQFPSIAQILERRITAILQQRLNTLSGGSVTRNVTPLDSSYNLGISYLFAAASVSAQYVRDKILDSDNITNTYTLSASIFAGDHWVLSPSIGQSKNDTTDSVTFGGLSVSYNW